jgi:hypothetical protein
MSFCWPGGFCEVRLRYSLLFLCLRLFLFVCLFCIYQSYSKINDCSFVGRIGVRLARISEVHLPYFEIFSFACFCLFLFPTIFCPYVSFVFLCVSEFLEYLCLLPTILERKEQIFYCQMCSLKQILLSISKKVILHFKLQTISDLRFNN